MRALDYGRNGPMVSLVLPTYNAGRFIDSTWRATRRFLLEAADNWEVLFVCDGCTDGTVSRLQTLCDDEPRRMRVLSYAPNRGKGYAVRLGLREARGQWRLFTDVDLAYSFDDALRIVQALRDGADVAIASRSHPESRLVLPPQLQGYAYRRHLQSQVFATLVRLLLPVMHRDTQAGLKGLSARAAQQILPRLRCDGFGFDCELLTACTRLGMSVTEVPVCVRYDAAASTTNLQSMGRMVRELWSIRRAWRDVPGLPPVNLPETERREAA